MRVLAIDTETTGLDPATDEVIQVGIVDATDGRPVLATHVRPSRTASWPDAEAVNHISPDMVADAPSQDEVARRVRNAVRGSDAVVAYNAPFDAAFLAHMGALPDDVWVEDLMMPVAVANGAWDERHGHARWLRLDEAAALAAYAWGDDRGHDAVADAKACAGVWRWLYDRHSHDVERLGESSGDSLATALEVGHGLDAWHGPRVATTCGAIARATLRAERGGVRVIREWSLDEALSWTDAGYGHLARTAEEALSWAAGERLTTCRPVTWDTGQILSARTARPEELMRAAQGRPHGEAARRHVTKQ